MNLNITKWPVIIFATPRTGSTALGYHIQKLNPKIEHYFCEPNYNDMRPYLEYSKSNSDYILKLLGSSIPHYPNSIFSIDAFRIKISRRDIIEQVASYYVARQRNIWFYDTDKMVNDNSNLDININIDDIRTSIHMVKYEIDIVDKISTDIEVFYEDFVEFHSDWTKKTPKPTNYNLLIDQIREVV